MVELLRWLNTFSRTALRLVLEKMFHADVHTLVEIEVLDYYARRTHQVWWAPVGPFKDYDGIATSKLQSVEVKFDSLAATSLNLCLEVSYRGEPSGLTATKARKWVQVVPVDRERLSCFEFDTQTLRRAVAEFPTYRGGDNNWSRFKLLPLTEAAKLTTDRFEVRIDWSQIRPYWIQ